MRGSGLLGTLTSRVRRPRTRFAPSPTGFLHLGHIVNAVYVWGIAGATDGTVVLRIEDHDRERSRPEYERAILDDLDWLGLLGSATRVPRQSERTTMYERALERLARLGLVFACDCTRKAIEQRGGTSAGELRYPGTCRGRGLTASAGTGCRVRMDPGVELFDDVMLGPQAQEPASQCGDLLLRDRVGHWTYHFAVVVDDLEQEIDLVVRGEDLLASTGRQIRLARMLGRTSPAVFLHHPLLYSASGEKLSKSNRDAGVRELRAAGVAPAQVLGMAAAAVGLLPETRSIDPSELSELFLNQQ